MFNNGKVNANAQKNLIKQKIISFPRKTNESLNSNKAHLNIYTKGFSTSKVSWGWAWVLNQSVS